jgi:hypothetical protein
MSDAKVLWVGQGRSPPGLRDIIANQRRSDMTVHTQGPWAVDGRNNNRLIVGAPGRRLRQIVAEVPLVVGGLADPTPEAEANARLVAAAPELFTMLSKLVAESLRPEGPLDVTVREAMSVLAKAEGRAS